MTRSEFKPGDKVRVVRECLPELPMGSVHEVDDVRLWGSRICLAGIYAWWNLDRFELVEPPPTIDPDEWLPGRAAQAHTADMFGAMYALCAWTLTNLAPVLLAGWAHRDPEPTVMVELPRSRAATLAAAWAHLPGHIGAVGRACEAALEQEDRNG